MNPLANAVIKAFDYLGGDASEAARAAAGWSYEMWVNSQAAQAACAGAGAMAVPIMHIPALGVDLGFLMHKMAYCAWGVGTVCGCTPSGKEDLQVILALWSGAISEDELFPVSIGGVVGSAVKGAAKAAVAPSAKHALAGAVSKGLPKAVGKGLPKAVGMGASFATKAAVGTFAAKVPAAMAVSKVAEKGVGVLATKLSEKVATKVAVKIGSKVTAKSVAGFIPGVSAAAGAGINFWFIRSIGSSARIYYTGCARSLDALC